MAPLPGGESGGAAAGNRNQTGLGAERLDAQALTSPSVLPRYVTLGRTASVSLNWTPVAPQVWVSGRLLPSSRVGNVVSFVIPKPKLYPDGTLGGGWGGPQTLEVKDGLNLASRTTYVLGRAYLAADTLNTVMFLLPPGRTAADLTAILQGDKVPITITGFTPLGGPGLCAGSLAEGSYSGSTPSFETILEQLDASAARHPDLILSVNPRTTSSTGADALLSDMTPMKGADEVGAPRAASRGLTGQGTLIAVLDTGVGQTAAGLAPFGTRLLPGQQFTAASQENGQLAKISGDDYSVAGVVVGHGTQVASLAAGALYGVAQGADVLPVKVCDLAGRCRVSDVVRGVCWAMGRAEAQTRLGRLILNLSLGGDTGDFERDVLRAVLRQAGTLGVQIAASAGNDWDDYLNQPIYEARQYLAALDVAGLTAVGAVQKLASDPAHLRTSLYSVRGAWVDLLAPGTLVWASGPKGQGSSANQGTSFAAPLVAGGLALWRQKYPQTSTLQLQNLMVRSASTQRVPSPDSVAEADPYKLTRMLDLFAVP